MTGPSAPFHTDDRALLAEHVAAGDVAAELASELMAQWRPARLPHSRCVGAAACHVPAGCGYAQTHKGEGQGADAVRRPQSPSLGASCALPTRPSECIVA